MGRTTKLTPELEEQIYNSARVIYHYKWIAKSVGIDEVTIHRWKNENKNFASQLEKARADFIRENLKRAKSEFKLETADREIFGNKQQIDVSVNPVDELLKAYGIDPEGVQNGGETNEIVSDPSENKA